MLNNKNTNNVETHSCNILLLVYLGLSIVYLLFGVGKRYNICVIYANLRIKGIKISKSSNACAFSRSNYGHPNALCKFAHVVRQNVPALT